MSAVACTVDVLGRTIKILRAGGARGEERVVLWLAKTAAATPPISIVEVYEPDQVNAADCFRLPPESLRRLIAHLRAGRLRVAAQVHTHPGRAFHSEADAKWAIVRHVGALSLVLPSFARDVASDDFLEHAVTYELTATDEWAEVPNAGPDGRLKVIR